MKPVRVSFRDFWPGFDPDNFFCPLLRKGLSRDIVVVEAWDPCDVEIVSVFPGRESQVGRTLSSLSRRSRNRHVRSTQSGLPSHNARYSIWYSGENRRPPLAEWTSTWSFEVDSPTCRNAYLPLWYLLLPELVGLPPGTRSSEDRIGRPLTMAELLSPRLPEVGNRPRFACAFIGNEEPTRMRAIAALRQLGEVDVYGSVTGRSVASKMEVAQQYQFMLCFENDVYPGYVTEKVIDAWACGCIPIWNGWDRESYLNAQAMVNLAALNGSIDSLVQEVHDLISSPAKLADVASQPILRKPATIEAVLDSLAAVRL